jgi:hypothetical protein
MRSFLTTTAVFLLMSFMLCLAADVAGNTAEPQPEPLGLYALAAAYAPYCRICEEEKALCWDDGTVLYYDDGIEKESFEVLLDQASLKDQMAQPYPRHWRDGAPGVNEDPGRIRNESFFRKIYGESADAVRAQLTDVPWLNGTVISFTRVNGADQALARVREKMMQLPPAAQRYIMNPSGSFNWREIAGTRRLSMHSFGIAVDFQLPPRLYRYWLWDQKGTQEGSVYPEGILSDDRLRCIVEIFESEGFIWGGKWHHYDTMHFEYRPELLIQEKR